MNIYFIANLDTLYVVGNQTRAYGSHINIDTITMAFYPCLLGCSGFIRVVVVDKISEQQYIRSDFIRSNGTRIVRFADSRELKNKFHLLATDVIKLRSLTQLRACREETILGNLVVCYHILAVRLLGVGTKYREMAHAIISRDAVFYLKCLQIPFYNFRRNKETGVCITICIELGMERTEAR